MAKINAWGSDDPAQVAKGGTGSNSFTTYGPVVAASTTTGALTSLASGATNQYLQSGGAAANPAWSTATLPSTATSTGTILRADGTNWSATTATYPNTTTLNQVLYSSSANTIAGLATATNGVLITDGTTGIPSISSTLPTAVQGNITSTGTITSGVWNGTAVVVTYGGTGRATLTNHGVLVGAATAAITQLAAGSAGQVLQSGGAAADPAYSTATYPTIATGTGTLLRADGTNWVATTSTYPNTNAVNTLLYASSANVMSALATANNSVVATSASGVPSLQGFASVGSSLVLITQKSIANNDASEIITSIPAYAKYMITFDDVRAATAGANLTIQYSTDNGSTYLATGYTSGCNWNAYNSATLNNVNTTTSFMVCPNQSTTNGVNGIFYLFNTNNNLINFYGSCGFYNNTGSVYSYNTATGINTGFTSFNALKILWSSGNFVNGNASTITLYGIRES